MKAGGNGQRYSILSFCLVQNGAVKQNADSGKKFLHSRL